MINAHEEKSEKPSFYTKESKSNIFKQAFRNEMEKSYSIHKVMREFKKVDKPEHEQSGITSTTTLDMRIKIAEEEK